DDLPHLRRISRQGFAEVEANDIPHILDILDIDGLIQSEPLAVSLEHGLAVLDPGAGLRHAGCDGADGVARRQARDHEVERSGDKDHQEKHANAPYEVAEVYPAHVTPASLITGLTQSAFAGRFGGTGSPLGVPPKSPLFGRSRPLMWPRPAKKGRSRGRLHRPRTPTPLMRLLGRLQLDQHP